MFKSLYNYFDKLEDRIRGRLSRYPILYTIIGGSGIVLFWRGVWVTADELFAYIFSHLPAHYLWLDGPISILISMFVLLLTGLFVSFFINDTIILSGVRQEKKLVEKTENEVRQEVEELHSLQRKVDHIDKEITEIHNNLH